MLTRFWTWPKACQPANAPAANSGRADDQPAGSLGGDVQHDQEDPEEQQRGAEVALEDQDEHADRPHAQDRAEVATARQVDEEHPAPGQGQRVAVQHEVAGEGDDQQHLGDLAGLEAERADGDPDLGAVDRVADDREHRQQQQHDRGQAGGVGQALEQAVVAQQPEGGDEEHHAQRHPDELLAREGVVVDALGGVVEVEAVDDRQAEAVERGDEGQQHRVGVRREDADRDVGDDDQRGQPPAVADDVGRDRALHRRGRPRRRRRCRPRGRAGAGRAPRPGAPVHESHQGVVLAHQPVLVSVGTS